MRISDWSSDVCSSDLHLVRIEIDDCAPHASARIIDHDLGHADPAFHLGEQPRHRVRIGRICGKRLRPRLLGEPAQLVRIARGNRHLEALARQLPREGGADPRSEERRVGKEGDSTWRSRWSPTPYTKNKIKRKRHTEK